MKKLLALISILSSISMTAQDSIFAKLMSLNLNRYVSGSYSQKVYLQTDRDVYLAGDTIWFSGVLVSANTHSIDQIFEKMLYLDFIDRDNKVLQQHIFEIDSHFVKGQLLLPKNAATGNYTIVSYTNSMKNSSSDFFYRKTINVKSIHDNSTKWKLSHTLRALEYGDSVEVSVEVDNNINELSIDIPVTDSTWIGGQLALTDGKGVFSFYIPHSLNVNSISANVSTVTGGRESILFPLSNSAPDIQFLPEGGSLVDNVNCVVAFKGLSYHGNPIDVQGSIVDSRDSTIAQFYTQHDGMGSFTLQPQKGEVYRALVEADVGSYVYVLPKSDTLGIAISVTSDVDTLQVTLNKNFAAPFWGTLSAHVRGSSLTAYNIVMHDSTLCVKIPSAQFPSGIAHITLFDRSKSEMAERLCFIDHHDNIRLSVTPDKVLYSANDSARLTIKAIDADGSPVQGRFAISLTNDQYINKTLSSQNITSYLLLQSDLTGDVVNPGWYFTGKNPEKAKALDLVMLTHGWRRFKWNEIIKNGGQAKTPESIDLGFYVEGEIRRMFGNKPVPAGFEVIYSLMQGGKMQFGQTTTDDDGKFYFDLPKFYDSASLVMQVKNRLNLKRDVYMDYKTNSGDVHADPFVYNQDHHKPPQSYISFKSFATEKVDNRLDAALAAVERQDDYALIDIPDSTRLIDEVSVWAKKKNPRSDMKKQLGTPDTVLEPKQISKIIEDTPWYSTIWDLLNFREIPELNIEGDDIKGPSSFTVTGNYDGGFGVIVDDDIIKWNNESDVNQLHVLDPMRVKNIDFYVKSKTSIDFGYIDPSILHAVDLMIFAKEMHPSVLHITTFDGKGLYYDPPKGIIRTSISGYTRPLEFYSPKYSANSTKPKPLLYWNPDVQTNEKGEATVVFSFTGCNSGLSAMAQGISNNGNTGVGLAKLVCMEDDSMAAQTKNETDNKISSRYSHSITGVVTNGKEPIKSLISIYQHGSGYYQKTSGNGFFALSKSRIDLSEDVTFSCPGYQTKSVRLEGTDLKDLHITMKTVRTKPLALAPKESRQIMKQALLNLTKCYRNQGVGEAFHREDTYVDNNLYLSNNALFNYSPLSTYKSYVKTGIIQHTAYEDDTGSPIEYPTANTYVDDYYLELDQLCKRYGFLNIETLNNYDFAISSSAEYDGEDCYVVACDQKDGIAHSLNKGILYISKTDLAILYVKAELSAKGIEYASAHKYINRNLKDYPIKVENAIVESQYSFINGALTLRAGHGWVKLKVDGHDLRIETQLINNGEVNIKRSALDNVTYDELKENGLIKTRFYRYPEFNFTDWGNKGFIMPNKEYLKAIKYMHYLKRYAL